MITDWINKVNTTSFRIVTSIGLAVWVVLLCSIGVTLLGWEPSPMQLKVLIGLGASILTMQGFDVLQFWTKRSTDAGLAAARNTSQPVQATVTVEKEGDARTASVSPVERPAGQMDPEIAAALEIGAAASARRTAGGQLQRDD